MRIQSPHLFSYEAVITFKNELSREQINEGFEELLKLKFFDGVKQVDEESNDDSGISAKLTTSNNEYEAVLLPDRLSIEFRNFTLDNNTKSIQLKMKKVKDLMDKSISVLQRNEIERAYLDYAAYTSTKADKDSIINETFSPKHADDIADFTVQLKIGSDSGTLDDYLVLMAGHTIAMHDAFTKADKHKELEKLYSLIVYKTLPKNPKTEKISQFFACNPFEDFQSVLEGFRDGDQ